MPRYFNGQISDGTPVVTAVGSAADFDGMGESNESEKEEAARDANALHIQLHNLTTRERSFHGTSNVIVCLMVTDDGKVRVRSKTKLPPA